MKGKNNGDFGGSTAGTSGSTAGTNTITLGGIFTALSLIFVFAASFVPGVELTLYALGSLFTGFMVIERGPKAAWIMFAAVAILGFVLDPNKIAILPYIVFFGYYGIVKFYIEKVKKPALQVLIKIAFFALVLVVMLNVGSGILFGSIQLPGMQLAVLYVGGIAMMLVYDFIYTLAIRIYRQRIKREKQPEFKLYKEDE